MNTTRVIHPISTAAPSAHTPESAEKSAGWRDYYVLTKPTISMLVVVTVVPTLLMANVGELPPVWTSAFALLGTWLASASASVFNHLIDADIDSEMIRTRARPLPGGRIAPSLAGAMGALLGVLSFALLYSMTTPLAAWVALAANAFYVLIYTAWLKRNTVQNIVIGGAAGAVGPLIGWAALTGEIGWPAWMLFLVIFLWTPPHFWALALKYTKDYAAAGVPMMPVVRGEASTRRQMFWYALSLIPVIASLTVFGAAGWIYLVIALAMTVYFAFLTFKLMRSSPGSDAMPVFHYSCLYLFGIFGALTLDRMVALIWPSVLF